MMKRTGMIGLLTAFVSSLCCTIPLLTLLVGATGSVGGWAWLDPWRPYSIALTVGALGWAWYEQLRPKQTMECACNTKKLTFWQSNRFLGGVTGIALLLLAFPSYSDWLYQDKNLITVQATQADTRQVAYVMIKGMTCTGCEQHVKSEVTKLKGVTEATVSYPKGQAVVRFDPKQTSVNAIKKAVAATGYQVVAVKTNQNL